MKRIVVGVDGSTTAAAALRWAVAEADLHGAVVVAVLAWDYLNQHHAEGEDRFDPSYGSDKALETLHATLQAVGPSRPVEEQVILDRPARALLEAGRGADLLVVGARGLGGFKGLLLGSVSERVLEQAPCLVAVVREHALASTFGAVAVGIDASDTARKALHWAASEARARSVLLHVVHAWQVPSLPPLTSGRVANSSEDVARRVLETALHDPVVADLRVEGHLSSSGPAQAVLELTDDAALIVVGSRGLGRLGRAVLGSTSRQLAHHASCPLVIVPADG